MSNIKWNKISTKLKWKEYVYMDAHKQGQLRTIASSWRITAPSWISQFSLIFIYSHYLKTIFILLKQFKITKTLRGRGIKDFSSRTAILNLQRMGRMWPNSLFCAAQDLHNKNPYIRNWDVIKIISDLNIVLYIFSVRQNLFCIMSCIIYNYF